MKSTATCLLILLLLGSAAADDGKTAARKDTPAGRMRAAFEARDEARREALLQGAVRDPWVLASELRRQQAIDAALWMAEGLDEAPRARLRAWLEKVRVRPVDEKAWQALADAKRAAGKREREKALALLMGFEPDPETVIGIEILSGRGELLVIMRRLSACAERLAIAGRAAEKLGWIERAQKNLQKAGRAYWGAGAYEKCVPLFTAAREHARTLGRKAAEGVSCYMLGIALDTLGRGDEAEAQLERAIALGREAQSAQVESMGLDGMGSLHERRGDSYTALAYRRRALALAERGDDAYGLMVARSNIAVSLLALGQGGEAVKYLKLSIAQAQKEGEVHFEAAAQINLGAAYSQMGQMTDAFPRYDRALALAAKSGNTIARIKALSGKASSYFELADNASARPLYEEALELARGFRDPAMVAEQLQNLGNVARRQDDDEAARAYHAEALKMRAALGDRRQVLRIKESLASGDAEDGRDAEAVPQFREILAAQLELGDRPGAIFTRINLADSLAALGRVEEAIVEARAARDEAAALSERYALLHAHKVLAGAHLDANQPKAALAVARAGMDVLSTYAAGHAEAQAATVRERFLALLEIGALAAWYLGDKETLFELLETGRAGALVEVLGGRGHLVDAVVPPALAARERAARQREGRAWERLGQAKKRRRLKAMRAARRELEAARVELQQIAEALEREARAAAGLLSPKVATLTEVQAELAPGEALVLYALFQGPACALVVTRDQARPVALGTADAIREATRAVRWDVAGEDPGKARAHLRSLLIESLALPPGTKRVVVSPAGEVAYVPFGALDPARTYALIPSATTRRYLETATAGQDAKVLALGDPRYGTKPGGAPTRYGGALTPLPQTRAEVEAIGDVKLLGADAAEATLAGALAAEQRWRAVHFACHGLLDTERPRFSSLALTAADEDDGLLMASEIVKLPVRADLVCMSACETGRGRVFRAEGVLGLTRAFLFAGASRVVCSLWKVDDEATRALMVKFYELWNPRAEPGDPERSRGAEEAERVSAAEALRRAQAWVRAQPRWAHPYYWGAWVLWGRAD